MRTTKHTEVGYTVNVKIVEEGLKRFGIADDSHLQTAVAAHIWDLICSQCNEDKVWGEPEITHALVLIQQRLDKMSDAIRCKRPETLSAALPAWHFEPYGTSGAVACFPPHAEGGTCATAFHQLSRLAPISSVCGPLYVVTQLLKEAR